MNDPLIDSNEFLKMICLDYHDSGKPEDYPRARAILDRNPSFASVDIRVAAALGNFVAVRDLLDELPALVVEKGGPFDWEPLLYLTYSRLVWDGCQQDYLAATRLLLEHGANPNAFFWWEGLSKFTALTGAFGEGERGPERNPPHPCSLQLARLLLEAGADPNDGQALYNTMLRPGTTCLEMLLSFGLNADHRINWKTDNPMGTLDYLTWHAVKAGEHARVKLLLEHGADTESRPEHDQTLYRIAIRHGRNKIAADLVEAGAVPTETPTDRFLGALRRQHIDTARTLVEDHPDLITRLSRFDREIFHQVAAHNLVESAALLLELGFPIDIREIEGYRHTPLHKAAMNGHLEMVKFLVERGADPKIRDAVHGDVPQGWARFHGRIEVADFMAERFS